MKKNWHIRQGSLKTMSAQLERWKQTDFRGLYSVYNKPSFAKECAWKECMRMMIDFDGFNIKVISYNTNIFTVGFIGYIEGRKAFFYITPTYNRYMFIDETAPTSRWKLRRNARKGVSGKRNYRINRR